MSASTRKVDTTIFYAGVITPFLLAAWIVPLLLLRMWVITMLWAWYIVPGFNVAPLRMSIAFGLSTIVTMLSPKRVSDKSGKAVGELVTESLINQLFPLAIGWAGSFFV